MRTRRMQTNDDMAQPPDFGCDCATDIAKQYLNGEQCSIN